MPSCVRKEKEKKIALVNSAKNCHKLTQLFKLNSSTTKNINSVVSSSEIIVTPIQSKTIRDSIGIQLSTKETSNNRYSRNLNESLNDFSNILHFQNKNMSDSCKYRVLNHRYIIEENYEFKRSKMIVHFYIRGLKIMTGLFIQRN
jgi:hypothetical protein